MCGINLYPFSFSLLKEPPTFVSDSLVQCSFIFKILTFVIP